MIPMERALAFVERLNSSPIKNDFIDRFNRHCQSTTEISTQPAHENSHILLYGTGSFSITTVLSLLRRFKFIATIWRPGFDDLDEFTILMNCDLLRS